MSGEEVGTLAAIQRRVSVRSYGDRPVDPALIERLLALAGAADHLTDTPPRVALVSGVERTRAGAEPAVSFGGRVA